jgi:hypothetical protein
LVTLMAGQIVDKFVMAERKWRRHIMGRSGSLDQVVLR